MTAGPKLIRAGLAFVLVATVVSSALGFSGNDGARRVGTGMLFLGLVVGVPLLVVGLLLKGTRRRRT